MANIIDLPESLKRLVANCMKISLEFFGLKIGRTFLCPKRNILVFIEHLNLASDGELGPLVSPGSTNHVRCILLQRTKLGDDNVYLPLKKRPFIHITREKLVCGSICKSCLYGGTFIELI